MIQWIPPILLPVSFLWPWYWHRVTPAQPRAINLWRSNNRKTFFLFYIYIDTFLSILRNILCHVWQRDVNFFHNVNYFKLWEEEKCRFLTRLLFLLNSRLFLKLNHSYLEYTVPIKHRWTGSRKWKASMDFRGKHDCNLC